MLVRNYGLKWTDRSGDDIIIARLTRVVDAGENTVVSMSTLKMMRMQYMDYRKLILHLIPLL